MNDKDNCRITCHLVGLEWFMYNRTPAYDVLATTLGLNPDASPFETNPENPNPSVSGTCLDTGSNQNHSGESRRHI